ncbi:copper-binding protein [Terribacillus saccharophilus]|uniref:Copper chaperone CopZ n=1 Tax=Terribacillus saccharophilus TaxID=361277 RepID=A0A268HH58_9BACI|nr:copper chaperone CopZ [Terribacillus saccharophilus]PAE09198.1 copper-binding protein [Terribacillus saccharophilus]
MEMTLQVNGMTCGHCEKAVKGALGELEGIQGVDVDLASGKVDVVYDDTFVTKNEMKEAIEEQGYDVVA